MNWLEILIYVIVAAICAAIAGALVGVRAGGFLAAILVGVVGAWFGGWIAVRVGLPELFLLRVGDAAIPIVWTVVGSLLILFLLGLMRRAARS